MLIHGDCLVEMKNIPDKSVDMVLCDPPYGTTACKWDTVIPFEPMWTELKRITKDNGAICLFGSEPFSSHLRLSNLKMFKYDWFWKKCKSLGANFCHARNSPIKTIEVISVFSFGKINHENKTKNRMKYFPQGLTDTHIKQKHRGDKITAFKKNIEFDKYYIRTKTGFPDQELNFKFEKHERKNRLHPTQKPVTLLEYLIKTYTLENETVLDFTMGSGSTGVACKNLNRHFIGIEKDLHYYNVAVERIKNA